MDDVHAECQRRLFIHGVDLGFFIMGGSAMGWREGDVLPLVDIAEANPSSCDATLKLAPDSQLAS